MTSSASRVRRRLTERLVDRVDPTSLAVFRIGFGAIVAWEVWRAFDGNLIRADYVLPRYHFTWWLFGWVHPLPGAWLYAAFAIIGIAGVCVAAGLFYRTACIVVCTGLTYWILLDKADYLNHRYLAALFALLLIFLPADAVLSLDKRRKPWVASAAIPAWPLWLLRFQVGAPYFFAGVAKLNFDWLVRAEPLKMWMAARTDFPLVGPFFTNNVVVRSMAIGSTILDLSVPFLLLHRRTRAPAFAATLGFHFMNSRLFEIGIFPPMMIVATTMFFEPDFPRRMVDGLRRGGLLVRAAIVGGYAVGFFVGGFLPGTFIPLDALVGGYGVAVLAYHLVPKKLRHTNAAHVPRPQLARSQPWMRFVLTRRMAWIVAVWLAVQVLLPLRGFVIPGNVNWTGEGARFAWHLLLRSKPGDVSFHLTDRATGATWTESLDTHLSEFQEAKMAESSDMILQFAHYLDAVYRSSGHRDLTITVDAQAELNGRPPQRFIDPTRDLADVGRPYLPPARWIVPLEPYE